MNVHPIETATILPPDSRLELHEIADGERWNDLVASLPFSDFRQGYEWGEVRASQGWMVRRLAIFDGSRCVAAVSVLARRLPWIGRSILQAPGGPLLADPGSERVWAALMGAIAALAAETRAIFLRVNPQRSNDEQALRSALASSGFVLLPDDWTTWNSPRIVMTLEVSEPEELLKRRLRRRTREQISSALNRNVRVRAAVSFDEGWEFHRSLAAGGRRKKLPVRGRKYFESLWNQYLRSGRGVLLLAEREGRPIGGLLGIHFGGKASMLYANVRDGAGTEKLNQGPLLYWEFIRWAKRSGCDEIDWGGVGTHFPPRADDPGFGLYHFKRGFNASLRYLSGYYDLSFSPRLYRLFRILERSGSAIAWTLRAQLNEGILALGTLRSTLATKARQLQVSVAQRGLGPTLYWAAFGFLRPNRFMVLARDLSRTGEPEGCPRGRCELWSSAMLGEWRRTRPQLPTEFFQDQIDGVEICSVYRSGDELAGLIWIYRAGDNSRLFRLGDSEAELNQGYVLPAYRGKGVFKEVLLFACGWLREQGFETVYAMVHAENEPSLRAFRGAGFRAIGTVRHFFFFRPRIRPRDLGGDAP